MSKHAKNNFFNLISHSTVRVKMWMHLASGQFDSRRKGAARVLTFGGVEAAGVEEKDASYQLCIE